ncbi:MAG TPA: DUF5666 domain-containing protein [Candidatus Paceibacterota bacterium]|nr:DUF5666 domain-containing protein [Candidatus Paceibacterota bacterium]
MTSKSFFRVLVATGLLGGLLLVSAPAFAQTPGGDNGNGGGPPGGWGRGAGMMNRRPGVFGSVTAINGTTLTINSPAGPSGGTATTYTVDASNATVEKGGSASTLSAIAVGDNVMVQGTVSGTNVTATTIRDGVGAMGRGMGGPGRGQGIFGTVASVNGNTLTVNGQSGWQGSTSTPSTQTTYTIDATNAKVMKNGTSSTVADIAVGDTVMVQGAVSGTNVTATLIRDGKGGPMGGRGGANPMVSTTIQGNGEPIVGGSVTAVNGSTLTVTNKSNVTYTVDVSNAKFEKSGKTAALSDVAVGDNVLVQGTVNGTNITASSVIDSGAAPSGNAQTNPSGNQPAPHRGGIMGFFGGIGQFFSHLFGW